MQTNDRPISELMISINKGAIQLPDFQRGWVWEDGRIKALIASITNNYPVGAAMFLEYGNDNIRFKYRVIEGVTATDVIPTELILDGQQRLTSIYSSLYSRNAVHTRTDKGKKIFRYTRILNSTLHNKGEGISALAFKLLYSYIVNLKLKFFSFF